jgi:hypothetical protein
MIRRLAALFLGVVEFRRSITTRVIDEGWYDAGRELAHLVTFRRYER